MPKYEIKNLSYNSTLDSFSIYKPDMMERIPRMDPRMLMFSIDRIKPDKTKVVEAMGFVSQINLIDILKSVLGSE